MKQLLFILIIAGLAGFKPVATRHISGTVYDDTKTVLPGVQVTVAGTNTATQTNAKGQYNIDVPADNASLMFSFIGFETQTVKIGKSNVIDVYLKSSSQALSEVVVIGYGSQKKVDLTGSVSNINPSPSSPGSAPNVKMRGLNSTAIYGSRAADMRMMPAPENTESYKGITENGFKTVESEPLSTFSVDVDAASYSNVRRFINNGQLPPADAVRIEEMINYFHYNIPGPANNEPVAIHTELSSAPWNGNHRLLRIGIKAKTVATDKLPASNLVFLIDVSGSMNEANKLPLVQSSLKMLVNQLRPQDRVAIVVYAGAAGVVLPATTGDKKTTINNAIDNLQVGGSTAGGAGIKLAYKIAQENFMKDGNNRVMLATDGDFNVGASSDDDMEKLIEKERESGISLSVLGFGMGNYKDSKMETLADKGNGNYAYIDNITEARKTLISEFGGTLFTIAKDVKLQVEFNPAKVQAYRLVGYENRALNKEDFNNDKKDAGDMGSGHNVTAFYEIVPVAVKDDYSGSVDPLKYQKPKKVQYSSTSDEMLTIKFRYKQPTSSVSKMSHVEVYDKPMAIASTSTDFRFAAAVAEVGMLLRDSQFKQHSSYEQAIKMARAAKGDDSEGYRAEFIKLAESAKLLSPDKVLALEE
ncbi:von Willebrand factor type A domain-containing protein [Mucilaginibacter sabulilitoris]|uniref:von Willebrand factor type A domain-containing protein n=1 Tax=Mucilaginibacter sabulilitoris TaxID=1173583 RepID=A0ABZ0TR59_9SPHI|nr:von Willebrand factor type A domain-containing protein [Mucilaginibacter sabulilitoris]WPU93965.1 von Willebrand factor type A domain-containing protein [Mucilaginibacter sabulilitoris]